ncbi:glyoxylase-like metal-dependent hydrolase (beta-lactamase superfamily II)/rhodanese-related sulfurtransferase [Silvimonas terrae]|uniref:Glyoxylase-like metal-dependent hydrolase (Beta-lactamase superfamily II)/rhodanese-related sulfurtransferase n=1 Tax=Silvimonas terrae TaxID=300266 RepID=A0A840RHW8_9NEIS|nr:MBL fold metallo-hydrolase [Silvimonas terrae]MBB5192925.1 glyoxylase-like metal-dependent hydrolase (beta-lactamase superfamily II)/rhodanese-related sulfurtransferase [Silvimonas terrae]
MIFRQLFDATSSTYSYLLGDSGEALLIDPVYEQAPRDMALLKELGLWLVATLDTHVHADHVTGAWRLRQRCGSRIALSAATEAVGVDQPLRHGDPIKFGQRSLNVRATPGHTSGCLTYVLDDESMAFTGDSLLIRGCGRTDFQGGSPEQLFTSVREQILTLPTHCLLYPAHDYRGITVSTVAEEKRFNPRLGGDADIGDFVGHMNNLNLPHPKLMAVAVPANLRCGQPEGDTPLPETPDWAPLTLRFSGVWEIEPIALFEHAADVQIVDVREAPEFIDKLGHLPDARLIPLSQLMARQTELDPARPVVAVCRSGIRSAQACVLLSKAGFEKVANLAGGMLRWKIEALPVAPGSV